MPPSDTARDTDYLDRLRDYYVDAKRIPTQQRISGILCAYDELIENSQRRIKILEAMARGLYREWFVHFRFPGHENHPRERPRAIASRILMRRWLFSISSS